MTGTHNVLLSLFFGFHMMVWSYFIENNARRVCQRDVSTLFDHMTLSCDHRNCYPIMNAIWEIVVITNDINYIVVSCLPGHT